LNQKEKPISDKVLKPKCKIWIEVDKSVVFGGGRLALFQAIDECGSINRGAAKLGMSYRAAWGKINATEKHLGVKLMDKYIGGSRSGSELTPEARKIMDAYRNFKAESIEAVDNLFIKYFGNISKKSQEE
jgi:molybdate transport system regulatory protein